MYNLAQKGGEDGGYKAQHFGINATEGQRSDDINNYISKQIGLTTSQQSQLVLDNQQFDSQGWGIYYETVTSQTLEDDANANGEFDTKEGIDLKDENVRKRGLARKP